LPGRDARVASAGAMPENSWSSAARAFDDLSGLFIVDLARIRTDASLFESRSSLHLIVFRGRIVVDPAARA
jgi:hypothetical protein